MGKKPFPLCCDQGLPCTDPPVVTCDADGLTFEWSVQNADNATIHKNADPPTALSLDINGDGSGIVSGADGDTYYISATNNCGTSTCNKLLHICDLTTTATYNENFSLITVSLNYPGNVANYSVYKNGVLFSSGSASSTFVLVDVVAGDTVSIEATSTIDPLCTSSSSCTSYDSPPPTFPACHHVLQSNVVQDQCYPFNHEWPATPNPDLTVVVSGFYDEFAVINGTYIVSCGDTIGQSFPLGGFTGSFGINYLNNTLTVMASTNHATNPYVRRIARFEKISKNIKLQRASCSSCVDFDFGNFGYPVDQFQVSPFEDEDLANQTKHGTFDISL